MINTINKILNKIFSNGTKNSQSGFSLVEVLVATLLFSIAITGIMTVAAKGGITTNSAKNNLTANYLAQEDIEIIRAMRDSYVLSNSSDYVEGWNSFVSAIKSACSGQGGCDIDMTRLDNLGPTGLGFINCASSGFGSTPCLLRYNSSGFYVHGTDGAPTPFTRWINIASYSPVYSSTTTSEIEVTANVYWKDGTSPQQVSMNESLFNWYTMH